MEETETSAASRKRVRALVVDDVATNRVLLRSLLKNAGYSVDECENGKECLEYCAQNCPDIILLDIMMPEMDGIQACAELRKLHPKNELPIIMVTTFTDSNDLARGLAVGASDYVTKPIDRQVLLARVENHVLISRAHREIQAQKQAALQAVEMQRALGDELPEAVAVEDSEGKIIYSNRRLRALLGAEATTTAAELFSTVYRGELRPLYDKVSKEALTDPHYPFEHEVRTESYPQLVVKVLSRPIDPTRLRGLRLWVLDDLTETRELENAVNDRMKFDTLGIFASGVAHNFNNALGGILGASEVLKRVVSGNVRAERCIDLIQRSVEAGVGLTKKLSSLLKIEMRPEDSKTEDLQRAIDTVVSIQELHADERIHFHVDVEYGIPPLPMNEQNLFDILTNLIANGVDAISGTGDVWIAARFIPEGELVTITVKDSGSGMDEATMKRVFEPFFSTKNMDTRNGVSYAGNGLGLWTVYTLTKMFKGDVKVSSAPGVGSEFQVILPVRTSSEN